MLARARTLKAVAAGRRLQDPPVQLTRDFQPRTAHRGFGQHEHTALLYAHNYWGASLADCIQQHLHSVRKQTNDKSDAVPTHLPSGTKKTSP